MEIRKMTIEQLEERKLAIAGEIDSPDADLNALEEEVRSINDELEARKEAETKKAELRDMVASGKGEITKTIEVEERKTEMTNEEIRNSKDYINAFAEYIKSNDDAECRALLTENVSGSVPVPTFVYDIVKTAWEREGIMNLVRKSYLRGNLKVGFEISADGAIVHTEGAAAIDPESLVLGVVEIKAVSIKKAIQISDEVYDLRGEEFLRYVYDELTYRIAKKAADEIVAKIIACGTVSTTTCPSVPVLKETSIAVGTVAKAMAKLSDEAANPVVIMNKATWGDFKAAQYSGSFEADPFEGLPVVFNNTLTAATAATTGVTYAIVGDLGHGALANFPDGEGIDFKFDDLTYKKQDLIEVFGRQYVGLAVVAPDAFVKITK